MRWKGRRQSRNIEDRRGQGGGFAIRMPRIPGLGRGRRGPGLRLPIGRKGGVGGLIMVAVVVGLYMWMGGDLGSLLGGGMPLQDGPAPQVSRPGAQPADEQAQFVAVVLADTEDTWHQIFQKGGSRYQEPGLVLFTDQVRSACGAAQSAMGPFYCPGDRKIYIDLGFYDELRRRFGAPGDFAQAYVIAHEVGHHVQTLLGINKQVREAQSGASKRDQNALQVRMELQADCFAGLWAFHADRTRQLLEQGDLAEALRAASAIGDDAIQKKATGRVVPDAFTHGSSEQRMRWFRRGFEKGDVGACDTFKAARL
ncbi:MAG: neutral zinc metallopeptidase [Alphaproteobacteria bacterium]